MDNVREGGGGGGGGGSGGGAGDSLTSYAIASESVTIAHQAETQQEGNK